MTTRKHCDAPGCDAEDGGVRLATEWGAVHDGERMRHFCGLHRPWRHEAQGAAQKPAGRVRRAKARTASTRAPGATTGLFGEES